MIYIKRSVDFHKDVTWIAGNLDEDKRRNTQLYAGADVNVAITAAVNAGLEPNEATKQAQAEIARCRNETIDTIGVA